MSDVRVDTIRPRTGPASPCLADRLAAQGFAVLQKAVPPADILALDRELQPSFVDTPFCQGNFYGERTKRFGRLLRRSDRVASLVLHPGILAQVETILAPWCDTLQLNLTQGIEIHQGALPQFPHRDQDMWAGMKGEVEYLVNVLWPLTPFTKANGATRIWPGSHGASALEPEPPTTDPIIAEALPGDAILFLGSTLHGAGANRTALPRRAIAISYCLGWLKPYENPWLSYPPPIARTFSKPLADLVGYRQHRPNLGNFEGQCPSILLNPEAPRHSVATDALRPDQAAAVQAFARARATELMATAGSS